MTLVFMQLNFPVYNLGFQMNFYFNQSQDATLAQTNYPPFMCDNDANVLTAPGTYITPPPLIHYVAPGPRLYYRSVKFQPSDNSRLAAMMEKGYTKTIKFLSTDFVFGAGAALGVQGSSLNQVITTSVVQPVRVWVLLYPVITAGAANATLPNNAQTTATARSDYASGVLPGRLQDANILINNLPYLKNTINMQGQFPEDWYERFKEQVDPQLGTQITYEEFLHIANYHCFDVSRLSDRLQSPTQSVSLAISATRSDSNAYPCNFLFLIERMNMATIRFSSSDVNMVVGNIEGA